MLMMLKSPLVLWRLRDWWRRGFRNKFFLGSFLKSLRAPWQISYIYCKTISYLNTREWAANKPCIYYNSYNILKWRNWYISRGKICPVLNSISGIQGCPRFSVWTTIEQWVTTVFVLPELWRHSFQNYFWIFPEFNLNIYEKSTICIPVLVFTLQYRLAYFSTLKRGRFNPWAIWTGSVFFHR